MDPFYNCIYIVLISQLFVICVLAKGGHGGHGGHSSRSGGGRGAGGHSSFGHGSSYHGGTHYTYHPPSHISYRCRACSSSSTYPVYHGTPPTIIYMYRESGTRSGDLLAGLALYNLGRASAGHSSHYISADDRCSLQIYDRYHFEEKKFPCSLVTSFVDSTARSDAPESNEAHSPNGTLKINYDECVVWHNETHSGYKERIVVSCALLQQYAKTIESRSSLTFWLSLIFIATLISLICCYSFYHKNDNKENIETTEAAPLSQTIVVEYHSNARNAVVMNVDCTPTHVYPNH